MQDQYRIVSPFYGLLSRLVFGKKLKEANSCYLSKIPNKTILILGGGDGSHYISRVSDLQGAYLERSESMLRKAKNTLSESNLHFHLGTLDKPQRFDLIFLPFVMDTMNDETLKNFLEALKTNCTPSTELIVSDFFTPQTWLQKFLTAWMLVFFRMVAGHARTDLPEYARQLHDQGFQLLEEKRWDDGWIRAQVWRLT